MLIYLIIFFSSFFLFIIAEKERKKNNKKIYIIITFIAILIPSVLAGLRDYSIGTDVKVYGNIWFDNAVQYVKKNDMMSYITWAKNSNMGIFYALLNYIVANFTNNTHVFYFVLSYLTTVLIYKAVRDNDDCIDVPLAMMAYYLLFFNQSLNVLRQSLALAFVLCSFKSIRDNKTKKFIIWILLATATHETGCIAILLYIVYKALNSKIRLLSKIGIIVLTIFFVIGFSYLSKILINVGVLSSKYEIYANNYQRGGAYVRLLLLCLPNVFLQFIFANRKKISEESIAFRYYVIISTIISFLAFKMTYITRIAMYFDILLVFSIPYACNVTKYKVVFGKVKYNKLLIIGYLVVYWIYVYGIIKSGETVPYQVFTV